MEREQLHAGFIRLHTAICARGGVDPHEKGAQVHAAETLGVQRSAYCDALKGRRTSLMQLQRWAQSAGYALLIDKTGEVSISS